MVFTNPSDKVLRAADLIALFDPANGQWRDELVNNLSADPRPEPGPLVVSVPVDSQDPAAVQRWRDRVLRARGSIP